MIEVDVQSERPAPDRALGPCCSASGSVSFVFAHAIFLNGVPVQGE